MAFPPGPQGPGLHAEDRMNKLSSLNTCQLTIQSGTYFKKLQLLNNQTVTIGRSRRATVQLDDTGLSQLHCKIFQILS